jgi:hypothetical protein
MKLFPLKTTLRRRCKQQAELAWGAKWRKDTKGRATFRNTPTPTKVLKLHEGLKKRDSALLVQLRTEKIGLKDFLFRRKVPDVANSRCECGARRQTVAHVLLYCRTHNDLRDQIFGRLPGRHNLRTILNKPQLATTSHQSHRIYETDADPWASRDQRRVDEAERWGETVGIADATHEANASTKPRGRCTLVLEPLSRWAGKHI